MELSVGTKIYNKKGFVGLITEIHEDTVVYISLLVDDEFVEFGSEAERDSIYEKVDLENHSVTRETTFTEIDAFDFFLGKWYIISGVDA